MICLDEASVLAFAEGRGDAVQRTAIEAHLDGCVSCLELVVHAARLGAGSGPASAGEVGSSQAEAPVSSRYELGAEIARGGMGRIFDAYDRVLGRGVAIKCVREDRPSLEPRFAREVALTAQLQHPAIVPIHDAGRLPDGRRFYAMRRIGGEPLDRRIAAARTLESRLALLPHVIALADAMAYVHSCGVIHRDLKPHNVLVGEFGETVLVDWGLAKKLDEPDTIDPAALTASAGAAATLDGEILGTRGYMAPEQNAGGPVGPAADVHGLGATLLHVITGRPPAPATDLATVPELKAVPIDLAAIVARAMAADPTDRYPSARELADDLHRFQTGRLVEAHQYTTRQRLRRWFARHRRAVALGAVAAVAIATISIAAIVRVVDARSVAEGERARAEEHRDSAQQLVDFVLSTLYRKLQEVGRLDALASTAEEVVNYYDRMRPRLRPRSDDRMYEAKAVGLLGQARLDSGDAKAALELFRRNVELAFQSYALHPTPRTLDEIAFALSGLGEAEHALNAPHAIAALRAAESLTRSRLAADPSHVGAQILLANTIIDIATCRSEQGDKRQAEQLVTEALQAGHTVDATGDRRGNSMVARASTWLVQLYLGERSYYKASTMADVLHDAAQREAARRPYDAAARHAVAVSWMTTGDVRWYLGKSSEAEVAFQEAHRIMAALVELDPSSVRWNDALGAAKYRLAQVAEGRRDVEHTFAYYSGSRDIAARLAAQQPTDRQLAMNHAMSELSTGESMLRLGDYTRGRPALERALEAFQRVAREFPSPDATRYVATVLLSLADVEDHFGHKAVARAHYERSLQLLRQVLTVSDNPSTRRELANALLGLAALDAAEHAPAAARARLDEATEVTAPLRDLAARDPYTRRYLDYLDQERKAILTAVVGSGGRTSRK